MNDEPSSLIDRQMTTQHEGIIDDPYFYQNNIDQTENVDQQQVYYTEDFRAKYKTELCKNWELTGYCNFEESCSFAHGIEELHSKPHIPKNYKTKLCKRFHEELYCPYGPRC